MEEKLSLLIVDDDDSVLLSLEKLIRTFFKDLNIHLSEDGKSAWTMIQNEKPNIVMSDISMPGFDGFQLCKRVRERDEFDDLYFIIMTASQDAEKKKLALNAGADDFINKPIESDSLKARLRSAIRIANMQHQIVEENKLLQDLAAVLENDVNDMTMLAVKFLQARIPSSFDSLKRIAEASLRIAEELGDFDKEGLKDIEISALLSQAGRIFLPDAKLNEPVLRNGILVDKIMSQVPNSGKEILSSVRRFSKAGEYVYHIYENIDGSGIPQQLKSWQIPLPSRIIRVALDFEEQLAASDKSPVTIIRKMHDYVQRLYDQRVVVLMEHYVLDKFRDYHSPNEKAINLANLQAGMKISRSIYTIKGQKLLPEGATLTERSINQIISHNSSDPILGGVYVYK